MDKNEIETEDLRGNPMLWTIEHWVKVMGPCVGSDGDLLFEKRSGGTYAQRRILLRATLQLREAKEEWLEDGRLPGSEETGDCTGDYAYLTTGAHDACDGLANDSPRTRSGGRSAESREARTAIGEEKDSVGESTQPMEIEEPSEVLTEVPADVTAEPLKEGTDMDSVIPLLKYLDRKREKNVVSKEVKFYVEMVRNMTQLKRAVAMKREWDSATEMAREEAAILSTECATAKAALKEREAQLREKKIECEVLHLNLAKESGRCAELEETCGGLCVSNENGQKMKADLLTRLKKSREVYDDVVKKSERLITTRERREKQHDEELAKLDARRAAEVRIAEELWGKIAEPKTAEEDLRSKIAGKCEMEFRRAEELSASLAERV
ncbi:hypothetical protein AXG93_1175s1350 [Marchantia polymorpha subsp. ruderalis]|uniref:Uncharacterized protein n=1 Tax=Marchantia polymorpha subsp. ruderalis TaxID=1480154 RepID=A0A176VQ83_MARPO|nr:hypothetical protein AXG93_1175s1350 [Marchantia polymorpha subsp. ruderalis]